MTERFQVDLTGMVDLLSHHLYSGPQVFLRELIQNGVDAIAARRAIDADAPATVRIQVVSGAGEQPTIEVTDSGVGLRADEARQLLSTIGRSSKRDADFGLARSEFIGQFGIGMLAAFMVADRIEVESFSARPGARPMRWVGNSDGTFSVEELAGVREPGTLVRLSARRGSEHWFDPMTLATLATDYGSLLPIDVAVRVPVEGAEDMWRRITLPERPWRVRHESEAVRRAALAAWCEQVFGFTPLGYIDLDEPMLGLSGVAFILPEAVAPGSGGHRVYAKRMLVGPRVDAVLPEWAFFARAVIDTTMLTPTASREQLHSDEVLLATREALAARLVQWATDTLVQPGTLSRRFVQTHHLALRAVARTDDNMLDLVARTLPFETSEGPQTLADAAAATGEVVYTTTTEGYRRVAAVARAQGLVVVNAGYVYDADLLARLAHRSGWRTRELSSDDLVQVLELPSAEREAQIGDAVTRAREVMSAADTDVIVREFEPENVPAMLLRDADGEHRRERDHERAQQPGLWAGLLDSLSPEVALPSRTLVLNDRSDVVRQLLSAPGGEVFSAGLNSIYLSAVMMSGEGLRSGEVSALNGALSVLLAASLEGPRSPDAASDERSAS